MSGFYKFQTFRSFISRLCGFNFFAQRVREVLAKLVQTLHMNGSWRDIENKRIYRTFSASNLILYYLLVSVGKIPSEENICK